MDRTWTLDEAQSVLPEGIKRVDELAGMRRDLLSLVRDLNADVPSPHGGVAEAKALEASIDDRMSWFTGQGIQVRGIAPGLLDFPARTADGTTMLCWLDGETRITHHHDALTGFAGREPVDTIRWPDGEAWGPSDH